MRKIKLLLMSTFIITNFSIVNAQVYTGVFKTATDNTDYHHFTRSNGSGAAVYINQISSGPILRLSSGIFDANQNVKFTVENNGYVGIGTINPSEKLNVNGKILSSGFRSILLNPDAGNVEMIGTSSGWTMGQTYYGSGGTSHGGWRAFGAGDDLNYFYVGNSYTDPIMVAKTGGNVGIGTTTPETLIHGVQSSPGNSMTLLSLINPNSTIIGTGVKLWLSGTNTTTRGSYIESVVMNSGNGHDLIFATNSDASTPSEKLRITSTGNVGIGTTTPDYMLDVQSVSRINNVFIGTSSPASGITIRANFPGYTGGWARGFYIANENGSEKYFGLGSYGSSTDGVADLNYSYIGKAYNDAFMYFKTNGNIGIGTASPLGKVDILAATDEVALRLSMPTNEDAAAYDIKWANSNADVVHRVQYSNSYYDFMNVNRATRNVTFNGGNIGIGTTTIPTGYKLVVDGKVICEEVKVEMSDQWADFVFEPTYNLMPLKELDTYIQENKHLPEIPTTAEVQENGISVGEMNAKLLQKIEELTLYVIELKKEVETLKEQNN